MPGLSDPKREKLLEDLRSMARGEGNLDRVADQMHADTHWRAASSRNIAIIAGLFITSAILATVCVRLDASNTVAMGTVVAIMIAGLIWHRIDHRAAYIAREMSSGVSRAEATRAYWQRYD
jgi:hypothetical protein